MNIYHTLLIALDVKIENTLDMRKEKGQLKGHFFIVFKRGHLEDMLM